MNVRTLDLDPARAALDSHKMAFEAFAQSLIDHNRMFNLTAVDSPEQIHRRHFLDSLAGLTVLDERAAAQRGGVSLIDVGSGAGFPALAMAIVRPQWTVISLEATEKKVRFQRHICQMLGLENVLVRQGRAEAMAHEPDLRERFDAAVVRAVAGLDVLAELTMAFVRPGGLGLFWKGPKAQDEIAASAAAFDAMGAAVTDVSAYVLTRRDRQTPDTTLYLVEAQKNTVSPPAYPRKNFAAIRKRPLH